MTNDDYYDDGTPWSGMWCTAQTQAGRRCGRTGSPWPGKGSPAVLCHQHANQAESALRWAAGKGAQDGTHPHHLTRMVQSADSDRVESQKRMKAEEEAAVLARMTAGLDAKIFMVDAS